MEIAVEPSTMGYEDWNIMGVLGFGEEGRRAW
jgi:hypothetical protein